MELPLHWLIHLKPSNNLRALDAAGSLQNPSGKNSIGRLDHSLVHAVLLDASIQADSLLRADNKRDTQGHQTLPVHSDDHHLLLCQCHTYHR